MTTEINIRWRWVASQVPGRSVSGGRRLPNCNARMIGRKSIPLIRFEPDAPRNFNDRVVLLRSRSPTTSLGCFYLVGQGVRSATWFALSVRESAKEDLCSSANTFLWTYREVEDGSQTLFKVSEDLPLELCNESRRYC